MGLKVITDGKAVTVYRQDKTSQSGNSYAQYSIGVSSKNANGEWLNGFLDCVFKKGVELVNKSKININNSFYTVNEYNGKKNLKLFVLDFDVVEGGAPNTSSQDSQAWLNIPDGIDDNLPFN
jgi:hypothetical protein